ncbi:hypothetical protein ACS0TY_013091 [Phlomoides rotata]
MDECDMVSGTWVLPAKVVNGRQGRALQWHGIDLYCAIILCELCRLVLAFKTTSILVLDFSFAHEESVDYMRLLPVAIVVDELAHVSFLKAGLHVVFLHWCSGIDLYSSILCELCLLFSCNQNHISSCSGVPFAHYEVVSS